MTFEVEFPDGVVIEGIPEGTPMEEIAARYELETGKVAPARTTREAAPEPEPNFLERSYDRVVEGVGDVMDTLSGQTYGAGGDPTAQRDEGLVGKAMSVLGSDVIPAAGDVISDAVISAGKAVLPESGERLISEAAESVIGSAPVQAITETWDEFAKEYPDLARRLGQTGNIAAAFAPAAKAVPKTNIGTKAFKSSQKALKEDRRTLVSRMLQPDETPETALRTDVRGVLKKKTYNPLPDEEAMYKEVAGVRGIKPKASYTENVPVLTQQIGKYANDLDAQLADVVIPIQDVKNVLIKSVNDVGRNPVLTGSTGESAVRIYDMYVDIVNKYQKGGKITAKDLLQSRRDLDSALRKWKKNVFDGQSVSAVSEATHALRTKLNDVVIKNAPDVNVSRSLEKQSHLLRARDIMADRVPMEAELGIGRLIDNLERSAGLKHPTTPLALQATASNKVVGLATAALASGWGIKRALTGETRKIYVRLLREVENAINKGGPMADKLKADKAILVGLINSGDDDE